MSAQPQIFLFIIVSSKIVGNSEELIYSTRKRSLDTNGQATITVKSKATHDLKFDLSSYDGSQNLTLRITRTACTLTTNGLGDIKTEILPEHIVRTNPYLPKEAMIDGTVYWLSIDRQSPHLRYGKYYRFKALTILDVPLGKISTESLNKLTTVDVTDSVPRDEASCRHSPDRHCTYVLI